MGKQYFLCPKCKELKRSFGEKYKEIKVLSINPSTEVAKVFSDLQYKKTTTELLKTFCCKCGFETKKYLAKDFLVAVIENENRIVPIGKYWAVDFKRDFVRIAKKLMEE